MSLKETKKIDANTYELEVSVDGAAFEKAIQDVYNRQKRNIEIPGFRKGKAPRMMIENMYGKEVFYEDAIEGVYPEALEEAIKEAKLDVIRTTNMEVVSVDKNGVEFKFTVVVEPEEVEIGEYKGVEVEQEKVKIVAADVNAELDRMLEDHSRMVEAKEGHKAKKDDLTVIDFEGFVDDVAFEGGKGENYSLTLGSGQFIPGFEDQIIGHKTGDEFDVNVTFPKEYTPELAGKDAIFKVKLHEIKIKETPKLDDEFVKDVSEFDTVADLKKDIRTRLKKEKQDAADHQLEHIVMEKVAETVKADIPQAMIDNAIDENVQRMDQNLQMQGLSLNQYLQMTGMEIGAFRDGFKDQAELQVKTDLALREIAKKEGIKVTKKEITEKYKELAEMYKMEVEAIEKAIPEESLERDLKYNKAIDIVKKAAVVVEPAAEEEKKPAKKTTKKAEKKDEK